MYVHPSERQQRRPGGGGTGHRDYGVTSMALQSMLPYHLVPQREATQLAVAAQQAANVAAKSPQMQRMRLQEERASPGPEDEASD